MHFPNEARIDDLPLYLRRLGFDAPPPPTLETLRALQLRHTGAFTFESLSPVLRMPVPIDIPSLERKILHEGRGGYCFELNRMYLALLQQLGFQARALTGRVVMGGPEDAWTARTHLLVLVTLDDTPYISDVGFGGMVPTAPLRLGREGEEQATPHEPYKLTLDDGRYTLRAKVADEWRAMYVFDLQPQGNIDFEIGNWYVSTHPSSHFVKQLIAARTAPGLRRTLHNGSYAVHRTGFASERTQLTDVDAVLGVLREAFGLRVPPHPELRATISRLIQA